MVGRTFAWALKHEPKGQTLVVPQRYSHYQPQTKLNDLDSTQLVLRGTTQQPQQPRPVFFASFNFKSSTSFDQKSRGVKVVDPDS